MTKGQVVKPLAAALAAAIAASAGAQNVITLDTVNASAGVFTPAVSENGYQPVTASVTGNNKSILETPRSVNVVTAAQLQDKNPQDLNEAIETVSGIRQGNSLAGTLDAVIKRGFGDNRDNSVLRNGMEMTQTHVFTPTAERVEVLKGPASVYYGVQDPGGVVNVVTKQPQREPAYTLSAGYGTDNAHQFGFDFTGAIGTSDFSYRLIADHRGSDYWRSFGNSRQTTLAPSITWESGNTKVTAALEYLDYKIPFDRGTYIDTTAGSPNRGSPIDIPAERRLDEPYSYQTGSNLLLTLNGEHKISENWTLKGNYGWTDYTYDDFKTRINAINTLTGRATRRIDGTGDVFGRYQNAGIALEGKTNWGGMQHGLRFALDGKISDRELRNIYRGTESAINIYTYQAGSSTQNPWVNTPPISAVNNDQTARLKMLSLSAHDAIHLNDKWIVSGGLRLDYYDVFAGREEQGVFKVKTDDHGTHLTPEFGVLYLATPEWSVYGNYAQSFRPKAEIGSDVDSSWKPEEGESFEIGTKYANDRFSAGAALFHITKKNVTYSTTDANGDTINKQSGKDRSYGLELDAAGQITDNISVKGSYAYTKTKHVEAEDGVQGTRLNNVPRHQLGLWAVYDFGQTAAGRWRAGFGGKHIGKWHIGNNNGGVWTVPSANVFDAFVSYDTQLGGSKLQLQLNAKNLFNETYYTSTVGNNATLPIISIGQPRSVMLNAKYEF